MELNTLRLFRTLFALGFYEEGEKYATEWKQLSNDNFGGYIYNFLWGNIINNDFEQAIKIGKEYHAISDTIPRYFIYMGIAMLYMNNYYEAAEMFKNGLELTEVRKTEQPDMNYLHAFAQLKTGHKAVSEKYFQVTVNYYDTLLIAHPELKTPDHYYGTTDRYWYYPYFILTCTWAARGNKEKALENLRLLRKNYRATDLQVVTFLKYFPMLDNIRNEPEFQEYLKEAENHYYAEHKKVEKLLREKGIIM
jgi:tetratricopeptide (TPR) repeat protein